MEHEDDFFVGIYDPVDVRRNLLESSKEVIKSLQTYEKLEKIRQEKTIMVKSMQIKVKELDLLISKLKTRLPKSYLRKAEEPVKQGKESRAYVPEMERNNSFAVHDLEKLEDQLRIIEKELSKLKH